MVDLTQTSPGEHVTPMGAKLPYLVEVFVKGSEAVTAKGSALANADVLQVLDVPAESLILGAGIEVEVADTDGSADILMDLGIGGSVDIFVDAGDPSSTGYLAAGTNGAVNLTNGVRVTADDTLDIVLGQAASFSSNDDWEIRVYAIIMDVAGQPEPQEVSSISINS